MLTEQLRGEGFVSIEGVDLVNRADPRGFLRMERKEDGEVVILERRYGRAAAGPWGRTWKGPKHAAKEAWAQLTGEEPRAPKRKPAPSASSAPAFAVARGGAR